MATDIALRKKRNDIELVTTSAGTLYRSDTGQYTVTAQNGNPRSSRSEAHYDQSPLIDRIRKSFASCVSSDGQLVIERNDQPFAFDARSMDEKQAISNMTTLTLGLNAKGAHQIENNKVNSGLLKSEANEDKFDTTPDSNLPDDIQFEVVGTACSLAIPKTEEELRVVEETTKKVNDVPLVQANVAEAVGGRAWELVEEEKAGETDIKMPEKLPSPRSATVAPFHLAKLDVEAERQKMGQLGAEKLKMVEKKRQQLLNKKREALKKRHGEREQKIEENRESVQKDIKSKIVEQELRHLKAAQNREALLRERREKLTETIEKKERAVNEKIVDDFLAEMENAEQTESGISDTPEPKTDDAEIIVEEKQKRSEIKDSELSEVNLASCSTSSGISEYTDTKLAVEDPLVLAGGGDVQQADEVPRSFAEKVSTFFKRKFSKTRNVVSQENQSCQ